jgi:hypothetical protein
MLFAPDPGIAFDSDAVRAMSVAFDEICEELHLPQCARWEREIIATRVVELARRGLLDRRALRDRVLTEAEHRGRIGF